MRQKLSSLFAVCIGLGALVSASHKAWAAGEFVVPPIWGFDSGLLIALLTVGFAYVAMRRMRREVASAELEKQELKRFSRLAVEREERVLALKEEVRRLTSLLGFSDIEPRRDVVGEVETAASLVQSEDSARRREVLLSLAEDAVRAKLDIERDNDLLKYQLREATEALDAVRRQMQLILGASSVGIMRLDASGYVDLVNPAALQMLGYSSGELLGIHLHDAVHVLHADGTRMPYEDCAVYKSYVTGHAVPLREQMFLHKSGSVFCADGIIVPVLEGASTLGVLVLFQDVTERKVLTEKVRAAYAGPVAMCLVADNVIQYSNARMAELTGLSKGDFFSRIFTRDEDRRAIEAHTRGHREMTGYELDVYDSAQNISQVRLSSVVMDCDYCSGMLYWLEDVSSLHKAETALARGRHAAMARIESLLARMSHEVRTPMNTVIGIGYLLRQSGLTAQQIDHMDKLQEAADSLNGIINNLLEYALLRSGQAEPVRAPFALALVAEEALSGLREKALSNGLDWKFTISSDIPASLVGDANRLGRILTCLVGNAVSVTAYGGVAVDISRGAAPDGAPDGAIPQGALWLHIRVRDSGSGMPPEQLEALSRPCPWADGMLANRDDGTPLGLALGKGLAGSLGGRMWAENAPERGSEIHCLVSLAEAGAESVPAETVAVLGQGERAEAETTTEDGMDADAEAMRPDVMPRALLTEDNEINQEIASELLRDLGLSVTVAENGERAVEAAKSGQYDIIFMDIQMPVMDGLEATRRIRASGIAWAEQVPIIAMTAHGLSDDRERSLAAGMNAHLTKPIDPQILRKIIATWLPQKQIAGSDPVGTDNVARHKKIQQLYGINMGAGIANVVGNEKLYLDLLRRFAAKYRDSQHDLPTLLEQGDIEGASRLAHTIKGVAANLGAVHLADMVKKIETALLAGETISHLLGPYARELARVAQGIEQLVSGNAMPAGHADEQITRVDAAIVPRILEILEGLPRLMQTDWGQAQEKVEELESMLEHTQAAQAYERLRNALEEFDLIAFSSAAETLAKLLR